MRLCNDDIRYSQLLHKIDEQYGVRPDRNFCEFRLLQHYTSSQRFTRKSFFEFFIVLKINMNHVQSLD